MQRFSDRNDELRRQDYETETLLVADLGTEISDATVDAVDGTAIVVAGENQQEFAVPEGVRAVTINNGVLTIEVAR
ncbi:hypothetical protein BRC86_03670 [Halobacteriales archaeon QS_3_64_16]|nr:MAG: hypothetical protein BRC86_03670 [Halobacteriales archaeon QS_3_64_16]